MRPSEVLRRAKEKEVAVARIQSMRLYLSHKPKERAAYMKGFKDGFDRAIALAEEEEAEE